MSVATSSAARSSSTQPESAAWSDERQTAVYFVPAGLVDRYVTVAMRSAVPRQLEETGRWYADLHGFPGVWADGDSAKECLDTLDEVLREWLFVKLDDGDRDIPVVDEIDLLALLHQR
jgi:predicted RNase H-like HicB family nuclease